MTDPELRQSPPLCPANAPLRDKLAQLMMVRIGSNLPPVRTVRQDAGRVEKLLDAEPLGGLVLFNGSYAESPAVIASLQRQSRYPLLVGSDLERGVGQQLQGMPLFPHAMAFGQGGDEALATTEQFARLTAAGMRHCGVHVNFAPVADVHSEPRNPIIATRAFADDPERAAEMAAAFVKGCRAGGVLATAKHFPGHGNTHEDSHDTVPAVAASRAELELCELVPFRAAIGEGVPIVMSAHVRYPGLDPSGRPATLSPVILIDVLRGELGFQGAVFSDSLLMDGVKSQAANEGELAVAALLAGIDVLLDIAAATRQPSEVFDHGTAGTGGTGRSRLARNNHPRRAGGGGPRRGYGS